MTCTREGKNASAEIFFFPHQKLVTAKKEAVYVAYLKASFLLVNLQIG